MLQSILEQRFLVLFRRNKWQNQDADAKWAVKKDAPAGKYDIKKVDSEQAYCRWGIIRLSATNN